MLWLFFTIAGMRLAPESGLFDAALAGFLLTLVCGLPVTFVAAAIFAVSRCLLETLRQFRPARSSKS